MKREHDRWQPEIARESFWELLERIRGENRIAVTRFLADSDHRERLGRSPGSRGAHHAWEGGWMEHERQTMMMADYMYELFVAAGRMEELPEDERFSLSDALTVMFLHDIEKPFVYGVNETGDAITVNPMSKEERKAFRQHVIDNYGFAVTPTMQNALLHVEGVRDEHYIPGARADQPLAAFCHALDNLSARAFYDHGRPL